MKLYVRYCGGCNPTYDRVGLISAIVEQSGFQTTETPEPNSVWLGVSGCPRECLKPPAGKRFVRIAGDVLVSTLMEDIRKAEEPW